MMRSSLPLFAAVALLSATPAYALDSHTPTPVVTVIDTQRILQESLAAKSVQKQLNSQRAKFQSETEKEENELRGAEHDLAQSRDHVSTVVYSANEQALRQRFLTEERHVEARRKLLDQSFSDGMTNVRNKLEEIVQQVAHSRGSNLVLIKQQIMWSDQTLDVTDEVLNQLNKLMPQVTIKLPPEEQ